MARRSFVAGLAWPPLYSGGSVPRGRYKAKLGGGCYRAHLGGGTTCYRAHCHCYRPLLASNRQPPGKVLVAVLDCHMDKAVHGGTVKDRAVHGPYTLVPAGPNPTAGIMHVVLTLAQCTAYPNRQENPGTVT